MRIIVLFLAIILSTNIYAQEVLDKIVAVVDNEIILKSELDFRVELVAAQRRMDAKTPGLREQVLNSIIDEKLVYAQANIDSIIVSEDEITRRIDYQIEMFKQQFGSIERIEQTYGMSIEKIRRELRDDVRKNVMIQRLQEKNFAFVETTRREVEEFFEIYRDSLGLIPERVKISHIFRNPKATESIKQSARDFAQALLDSIKAGADFAELAKRHSEDPGSAVQGGDLGFVKRGVFFPEFESAAFALDVNQISDVVESPVGFHIIEMLERRGESIRTRHILVKVKTDEEGDLRAIEFLNDVRDSIVQGIGTFGEFAIKYSEDTESAPFGGSLGSFYINQLDKALLDIVSRLKEGEISFPRRVEYGQGIYGYHIVYLESRIPQHPANLEQDYIEIKRIADEYKRQKLYEDWIENLRDKIFWEVRI